MSNWLKGTLDYYFQASNLLIIETKRENLYTGFTQLAAELIALHLTEDLTLYRIPQELEILTRTLIGIIAEQPTVASVSSF